MFISNKLLWGICTFKSSDLIVFPTRVVKQAPLETVSSVMEKRETFVQAVSKELVEEFLQFVQLDVSCALFLLSF